VDKNKKILNYCLFAITFSVRIKPAVNAANPATNAPIRAVANINKKALSVLKINMDTRLAKIFSLLLLIQRLNPPHNKNSATNPDRNETHGFCGISAATTNATIAILHQGKYKQAQKLNSRMIIVESVNFIGELFDYLIIELFDC
jgi:hypothetical protein